jgi:L-alanine-DL-glutamate epimerase-like enolase superfamily enzyme
MKITAMNIQLVAPAQAFPIAAHLQLNPVNVVIRLQTDARIEGVASTSVYQSARSVGDAIADLRTILIDEDPLDRERIWQRMYDMSIVLLPPQAIAVVDCALWDIAGKAADLPIHRLLGTYRESLPAYASTLTYDTVDEFKREVEACLRHGFRAIKLHVWGDPRRDIKLCREVRMQVGDDVDLMVDAAGAYDVWDAVRVGRVLEDLNYKWFEMPVRDQNIDGYVLLTEKLDIPITSGEFLTYGFHDATEYITRRAWSILRIDAGVSGGITAAKKAAVLAEAFGLGCELHSWGFTLNQAANLHVMASSRNCRYFEFPMPIKGLYDYGMRDVIEIDSRGEVHVPSKPGLGVDVDWEKMAAATVAML